MSDGALLMRIRTALKAVRSPRGGDIISDGAVDDLSATSEGVVRFKINAEKTGGDASSVLAAAKAAAEAVEGVARVVAISTADRAPVGGHDTPLGLKKSRIETAAADLMGVNNVIAIASGKGGVGKSTVAANLAVAFAQSGLRTGLLDADIYGPSLPTLFGLSGRPELRDGKMVPFEKFGVRLMSIGFLVDEDQALAWRGPLVMGALRQLIGDVDWGALDVLVIDTPPGTGDAHLSLAQSKLLTGAVIVSTPQEMALADVRRGIAFFRKVSVPIIGVIENMAWLDAPDGGRSYLFGKGGAGRAARDLGAAFLGPIPIYSDLCVASDEGIPLSIRDPDAPAARAFTALAATIAKDFKRDPI